MFLSLWAVWYHLLAGVRHLIWDAGYGLDLKEAEAMGWCIIGGSVVLTLVSAIAM
jgi:succinate dehydrogenase / fumarate reductase cytochrome b subunit